uniref:Uncharacterized protein n=1 Tax=Oryza nivara TaxID=4536 RepID=A0A0E0FWK3_ORYNI
MAAAAAQYAARHPRPCGYRRGLRRLASRWTTSPSTASALGDISGCRSVHSRPFSTDEEGEAPRPRSAAALLG